MENDIMTRVMQVLYRQFHRTGICYEHVMKHDDAVNMTQYTVMNRDNGKYQLLSTEVIRGK